MKSMIGLGSVRNNMSSICSINTPTKVYTRQFAITASFAGMVFHCCILCATVTSVDLGNSSTPGLIAPTATAHEMSSPATPHAHQKVCKVSTVRKKESVAKDFSRINDTTPLATP